MSYPPFILAAKKGDLDTLKQLEPTVDLNAQAGFGYTALICSVIAEHHHIVEYLAPKVDLEIKTNIGYTALVYSVKARNLAITKTLLAAGAKMPDNILTMATTDDLTELLINSGANVECILSKNLVARLVYEKLQKQIMNIVADFELKEK